MRPKKVSYLATALCGTIGNQSPSHRECHGPWRRGPYLWQARLAHPRSLCLVGVALGDIGLHLVWQAWHFWHWAGSGDALGRGWSAVMPRFFAWQAWHLVTSTVTLCGRRGTYGTGLGDIDWHLPLSHKLPSAISTDLAHTFSNT